MSFDCASELLGNITLDFVSINQKQVNLKIRACEDELPRAAVAQGFGVCAGESKEPSGRAENRDPHNHQQVQAGKAQHEF